MSDSTRNENFLWFSFFGITKDEATKNDDHARSACVRRAFRDACRGVGYTYSVSELDTLEKGARDRFEKMKTSFREEAVPELIRNAVDDLLRSGVESTEEGFDGWHEDLCKSIFECACSCENGERRLFKNAGFTYGHAQKWVNMTLKYMYIMGLWKRELCRYKGLLHVPIDSYVLEVARADLGIRAPWASLKKIVKYDEYLKYQKDVRAALKDCDEVPIDWESHAWITAAERAKGAPASER